MSKNVSKFEVPLRRFVTRTDFLEEKTFFKKMNTRRFEVPVKPGLDWNDTNKKIN